ncbi:hypothetical protein V1511DRAFT_520124 [Dipodascopsis uninucleata]
MDIAEFTASISPVHLQDPLGSASHMTLAASLALSQTLQVASSHDSTLQQQLEAASKHIQQSHLTQLESQGDHHHEFHQEHQQQLHEQQDQLIQNDQAEMLMAPDETLDLSLTFPSKDALLLHLNRYATQSGFRLSRTSSRPEHIRIQCWKRSKTSKYTRTEDPRKRRASYGTTRSTDCPFFLNCWHNKKSGCWYIKSSNIFHNHSFAQDLISKKSLTTEEKSLLRDLSYAGSDLTRSIPVKIINAKRRELGIPDVDPKLVSNTLTRFRQQLCEKHED